MTKAIAKKDMTSEKERVKQTLEDNSLILAAKSQQQINELKDISGHFFKVGSYKDSKGQWQDKMEPDSFALQTLATVQKINTETLTVEWENADDLKKASVRVRVRAWKGKKDSPSIEKTVELRLSMRTIAMKYVTDKMAQKTKWQKGGGKSTQPAEWNEEDVIIADDGWMQPKTATHQIAMLKYLTDQYAFLDRTAETKAERRANIKLLGFDWRDPNEMTHEDKEIKTVGAGKGTDVPQDALDLIANIKKAKDQKALDKLAKKVDEKNFERNVHKLVVSEISQKMSDFMESDDKPEPKEEVKEEPKKETPKEKVKDPEEDALIAEIAEAEEKEPLAEQKKEEEEEIVTVSGGEMQKIMLNLKGQKSEETLRGYWQESVAPMPLDDTQKKSLTIVVKQKLQAFNEKANKANVRPTPEELKAIVG